MQSELLSRHFVVAGAAMNMNIWTTVFEMSLKLIHRRKVFITFFATSILCALVLQMIMQIMHCHFTLMKVILNLIIIYT